jgi:hypothetical protein
MDKMLYIASWFLLGLSAVYFAGHSVMAVIQ